MWYVGPMVAYQLALPHSLKVSSTSLLLPPAQVKHKLWLAITCSCELGFECRSYHWNRDVEHFNPMLILSRFFDFDFWAFYHATVLYEDLPRSSKHGNNYVFIVINIFSMMVILATYEKSIIAKSTAKAFFERVWVHFGIPQSIISYWDNKFLTILWLSL